LTAATFTTFLYGKSFLLFMGQQWQKVPESDQQISTDDFYSPAFSEIARDINRITIRTTTILEASIPIKAVLLSPEKVF
jgi:hypothetical protein